MANFASENSKRLSGFLIGCDDIDSLIRIVIQKMQ